MSLLTQSTHTSQMSEPIIAALSALRALGLKICDFKLINVDRIMRTT